MRILRQAQLLLENLNLKRKLKTYEEVYQHFQFDEAGYEQRLNNLKSIWNPQIDILLAFLNRWKFNLAENSLRKSTTVEEIKFRDGSFRVIEELQQILISSRKITSFDNKIIGEKTLAK